MAANVESMFYVRETPWHGLGTKVQEAPDSKEALRLAGLDWKVLQEPIRTAQGEAVPGYKANVRDVDRKVLGVVTDRYKVIQNEEAFAFVDSLLGEGVRFETAGSLQEGKSVWLLAHLPHEYIISGERISPYLVFSNTHDGSGAVKAAITPIRVVCNNTLNLALSTAKRSWSMIHTGDIKDKIISIDEMLNELQPNLYYPECEDGDVKTYMMTNRQRYKGAVGMLRLDLLKQLAEKEQSDLYIFPSSIHECVLVPVNGVDMTIEELQEMLQETNESIVSEEERLDNVVYYYRRMPGKIEIAENLRN